MSNWANRTKETLAAVDVSNLKPVGGSLEPIARFYQTTALKPTAGPLSAQLNAGDNIRGTYEGKFITKKFNTTYYKIRTSEGLVAVPGSGQLNSLMARVADGSDVQITYKGKEVIAKGQFAGKSAHSFSVAASEQKAN